MNKKITTYEHIARAAETIFSRHGYAKATLDEIARLADVGKGTIYNYFGNKEQLLYQLLSKKNIPLINDLKNSVNSSCSLDGKLLGFFTVLVTFYRQNSSLWQIIFFEMSGLQNGFIITDRNDQITIRSRYEETVTNEIRERVLRYHELIASEYRILEKIIIDGINNGEIVALLHPEIFCQHLFFGVTASIFHHEPEDFSFTAAQCAETIVQYYLDGIRKK